LRTEAGLDVVCIDFRGPHARQNLSELTPAAILFDLSDPSPCVDVTLLRERPGLLLIGVDPSSDELLVLRGYTAQALSVRDLANAINRSGFNSE